MQEDAVEGQVVISLDDEAQREPWPEVEPELLDQRDSGRMRTVRKGEAGRSQSVVIGQLVGAMDPDLVVQSYEVSRQDAAADAQLA